MMKKRKLKVWNICLLLTVIIAIVAIAATLLYFEETPKKEEAIKPIEHTLKFEYGNTFTMGDILDEKNKENYTIKDIDETLSKALKENTTNELAIHDYLIDVIEDDKLHRYHVKVEDTIQPVFTTFTKTLYVKTGTKNIDWSAHYKGMDRSEVSIDVNDEEVMYQEPGQYTIQVTIKDEKNNQWSDEATVVVGTKGENVVLHNYGKPTYVDGILVVNKLHPIPKDFAVEEDQKAASQVRKLIADMQKEGLSISSNYSGYRCHDYQTELYNNYVKNNGKKEADTFSARPGYSEHETGLTFDLIDKHGELVESKKEADWIAKNAHKYGFIVRYPEGKEEITGYMPEAWHLRYVGDVATKIYESNLTLEEYLDVPGGPDYNE